jgi:cobalamin-dependent methionine synthase I
LLRIGTRELNLGGQVSNYIKEAKQIALFVCTASERFTTLSNELNEKGDVMEAYIVDAIGSLTVENTMDRIQEQLRISMNKSGWEISNRYSPGYCNWPLSDQKNLFEIIGNNSTEITINDSCLMTPRKSISGIIGIGKNLKQHEYGCKICTNDHCIYRKLTVEIN